VGLHLLAVLAVGAAFLAALVSTMRTATRLPRFLSQAEATQMDVELMGPEEGFSVDELMELAGLSVAAAVVDAWPPSSFSSPRPTCLVIAGPGNNGGDGLVAARHLHHFGYALSVHYPRFKQEVDIYARLVKQLRRLSVSFLDTLPAAGLSGFDVVVDAVFGYSFKGEIRAPFGDLISQMAKHTRVAAIDVPSGWDVEKGDVQKTGFAPALLVSLTAPKLCAKNFSGQHYLGGRFVPDEMAQRYQLDLPPYPGSSQVVRLQ
jgi:hydroxyethylthiazole kinase-like uncharacterized protein yjeF